MDTLGYIPFLDKHRQTHMVNAEQIASKQSSSLILLLVESMCVERLISQVSVDQYRN